MTIKTTMSYHDNDAVKMLKDVLEINMSINSIHLVEWVHATFLVEEVYPEDELERWAKENGWIKEEA